MFKFTKHAVERMQEREITETEIMAVLKKEKVLYEEAINYEK